MNISVESLQLLEKVSANRVLHLDASKVPRYESVRKQEHMQRFLRENAPEGVLRAEYWLDGKTCGVRSKPNLQNLNHALFKASEGHVLVEVNTNVETLCCLRSSGTDGNELADRVTHDRVNLWDYITMELVTEEEKAIQRDWQGALEPLLPSRISGPLRTLRQYFKVQFFRGSYGIHPPRGDEDYAVQEAVLQRLIARWPGLWLTGTKEEKQAVNLKRRLHAATVWLQVALKAEQQGCQVVGFWMDEPIIECPVSINASEVKYYLENEAFGMLS